MKEVIKNSSLESSRYESSTVILIFKHTFLETMFIVQFPIGNLYIILV